MLSDQTVYDNFVSVAKAEAERLDGRESRLTVDRYVTHFPATRVEVCRDGLHLRVSYRREGSCHNCGRSIEDGPLAASFCDEFCNEVSPDYQHGCGAWNYPTQQTFDLDGKEVEGVLENHHLHEAEDEDDAIAIIEEAARGFVHGAIASLHEEI